MTNPQKSKELLSFWTTLKQKLTKLTYLNKSKKLIREAVEFYSKQSVNQVEQIKSSAEEANRSWVKSIRYYQHYSQIPEPTSQKEVWPGNSLKWRNYYSVYYYFYEKEKSEKITKQCKEFLEELNS